MSVGLFVMQDAVGTVWSAGCGVSVWARDFEFFAQSVFQFFANVRVFFEKDAGVFAALAHAFTAKADPRAGLFKNALVHAEVDEVAFAGNAFAVENVELGFTEGCGDFVFYNFGASA